jgi:outer membrane receptor protein involved in Fe transport
VLQTLGRSLQLSGSVFYSRFSHLIRTYGTEGTVGGSYLGWPVDYIDYTVNQGHSTAYGTTFGLDYLRSFGPTRRLEAHAAAALADGRQWPRDDTSDGSMPTAALAPVQLRFGLDLDWDRWQVAPRLSMVGAQRVLASAEGAGASERRTLPGYATVDLNVRRTLLRALDAFLTVENALDRRYRTVNPYAYTNTQELIGAPQNPRRVSVGFSLRLP